jgi:dolichol-phosphate mannosyltransferase
VDAVNQATPQSEILVVDDSSPDGTGQLVANLPRVHLLERSGKRGLGRAYVAGFQWALSRGYTHVVQMDADFSHDPGSVPKLLSGLEKFHFVIGSRYIPGGATVGWPPHRKALSHFANLYAKTILGIPIQDYTGGFNAWRREVLESISPETLVSSGYLFLIELKYRAATSGFEHSEIPIVFKEREEGVSKMSKNIISEAAVGVLRLRFGRRPKN